jgi:hypothetical protein
MSVTYNFMLSVLSVDNYKGILKCSGTAEGRRRQGDNDGDNKGDKETTTHMIIGVDDGI